MFCSQPAFPSQHQLEYVGSMLKPISSEIGLRHFEREVVKNAVQTLVNTVYQDAALRRCLGIQGMVTFESHTNLGDPVSEAMERMSIGSGGSSAVVPVTAASFYGP